MKLGVLGTRFSTAITAHGSTVLMTGENGDVLEVDEETAAALMRDLPGTVIPFEEAETVTPPEEAETVGTVVEMAEVPAEIVAPPVVARTRQIVKKPAVKARAAPVKAAAKPKAVKKGKPKGK